MAIPVLEIKGIIEHFAIAEDLLVPRSRFFWISEIVRKIGADELIPHVAGLCLSRSIHVGNFAVRANSHQRVEADFNQTAVVGIRPQQRFFNALAFGDIPEHSQGAGFISYFDYLCRVLTDNQFSILGE